MTEVPFYDCEIATVECANHAVKCYRNRLEVLCNDKLLYRCTRGLSKGMMKRITHSARCAIKMHSGTADVVALHHDLRNGPCHYVDCMINETQPFTSRYPKSLQVKNMQYVVLSFLYCLPVDVPNILDRITSIHV